MTKVAPRLGFSDVGLAMLCRRRDIPRPPVGYWAQQQFGKQPSQTPLPPAGHPARETIEFSTQPKTSPTPWPTGAERVSDQRLKRPIEFEEQPENCIVVCYRGEMSSAYWPHLQRIAKDKKCLVILLNDKDLKVFIRQSRAGKVKESHIQDRCDEYVRKTS